MATTRPTLENTDSTPRSPAPRKAATRRAIAAAGNPVALPLALARPIEDGIARCLADWTEAGTDLWPARSIDTAFADLQRIQTACTANGLTTLDQLPDMALDILATILTVTGAGVRDNQPTAQAEDLHRLRNTLLAMLAWTAVQAGGNPLGIAQRFPLLTARTTALRRALYDDEIALLRISAYRNAQLGKADLRVAALHCVSESGVFPAEATATRISSFDDPDAPTTVKAIGNERTIEQRTQMLNPFTRSIVRMALEQDLDNGSGPEQLVCYRGDNTPGENGAQASASNVLDTEMAVWGLQQADVTAASIAKWAIEVALTTRGIDAATDVAGTTRARTYQMLGLKQPLAAVPDDLVGGF